MAGTTDVGAHRDAGSVEGGVGGKTWYEEFYGYIDGKDDSVVDLLCTPDTSLRFNYHEPIEGRENVRAAMHHFWGTISGMSHRFVKVIEDGDSAFVEAVVTYTRLDGSNVDLPVVTGIERRDGLVAAQRVYIDATPLHAGSEAGHETGEGPVVIEHSTPTVVANPEEEEVRLSREQLWQGLVWKARYAQLFVEPIKECNILETYDDGFLREVVIELGDKPREVIQERIFLEPMERVTFLRLNGSAYGQIVNIIETDETGEPTLRFTFTLALEDVEHGSPEEADYEEQFSASYLEAVRTTLDAVRDFVRTGEDPTELARAGSGAADR